MLMGHCVLLGRLCQPQAAQGCFEKTAVRQWHAGVAISLDSVESLRSCSRPGNWPYRRPRGPPFGMREGQARGFLDLLPGHEPLGSEVSKFNSQNVCHWTGKRSYLFPVTWGL